MSTNSSLADLKRLQRYTLAMTNAESHAEISTILADTGYDPETLSTGKKLLEDAQNAHDIFLSKRDKMNATFKDYNLKKEAIDLVFYFHRKKARVIYRKDPVTAAKLAVNKQLPKAYVKWFATIRKFYSEVAADPVLQEELARLKISSEEINDSLLKIKDVQESEALYMKQKAESEQATKNKVAAFRVLNDWMMDFFAVAQIALIDKPQYLEAFGKVVKS